MMTANRCSTLESLTSPLSPFAFGCCPDLTSEEGNLALKTFQAAALSCDAGKAQTRDRGSVELGYGKAFEILADVVVGNCGVGSKQFWSMARGAC
jgi:hypothetical protein